MVKTLEVIYFLPFLSSSLFFSFLLLSLPVPFSLSSLLGPLGLSFLILRKGWYHHHIGLLKGLASWCIKVLVFQKCHLLLSLLVQLHFRKDGLLFVPSSLREPFQIIHYNDLLHSEQISPLSWSSVANNEADI